MRVLFAVLVGVVFAWAAQSAPLTFNQGTNFGVAVSPDGKSIVFDLQGTLWVMPAAGGEAKAITDRISDARAPAWSPDGSKIAFQSFRDGGWHIYTVAPDGADHKQITSGSFDEREPAWSPDGQWIAFSSDRDGTYAIWVMAADGTDEPRLLTITPSNEFAPTWSPDGKRIAYVSDRPDHAGIYSITFEGVAERLMAPFSSAITGPSWSPNGKHIAFVETTRNGARLKLMDASSTVVTDISAATEDVFPFRPAWLKDEVVYTADAAIKQLNVVNPKAKPRSIPFKATVDIARETYTRKIYDFTSTQPRPVKGLRGPQISPDGKRAVFTALGDLWLADVTRAGTKPQQLTDDAVVDYDPAWSPDGKLIAFASDRTGKTEIWLRDLKANTDRQLTNLDGEVQKLVWSPDGKRIAFYKAGGLSGLAGGTLHTVDVASGEVKQIRPNIWAPSAMSWSPDGSHMALSALAPGSSRFREGLSQFMIIGLDKDAKKDQFETPHPDKSLAMRGDDGPMWSPDGKSFAYVFDGRLWTVPVTPEGEIAGPPLRMNEHLSEAPSWTADSQTLFYVATDRFTKLKPGGPKQKAKPQDVHPNFTYTLDIPKSKYVLRVGKLFDGVKDTYAENIDVLIDGNRIESITPRQDWPTTIKVVDASDKAVIPGMMESHTHQSITFGERLGRLWLAMGVTSVREPGTDPYDALERREAWASGRRLGPREFYAGALTDGTRVFYGFANSVTTPEHLELEMVRAKQLDFDMIKTYVRMPDSMQQTIVTKAHEIGIPVSSHEIYPAVGYNVDAVEHLKGTSRRGFSPKQSELGYSYSDVIDMLSRTGMTVTPTIGLSGGLIRNTLKDPTLFQHPVYTALYTEEERKTTAGFSERSRGNLAALDRNVAAMQKAIKQIVGQGGHITAGTDSPFMPYGFSFQVELELYEEAGLSPYQVLLSATAWPAERLGVLPHLGTLEVGKLADLVVVDGDPLARIKDLRNISAVVSNGRYLTRDELLKRPNSND